MQRFIRCLLLLSGVISFTALAQEVHIEGYTPPPPTQPVNTVQPSQVQTPKVVSSFKKNKTSKIQGACFTKLKQGLTLQQGLDNLGPKFAVVNTGQVYEFKQGELEYLNDGSFFGSVVYEELPEIKNVIDSKLSLSDTQKKLQEPGKMVGNFYQIILGPKKDNVKFTDPSIIVTTDINGLINGFNGSISCD